LRIGVSGLSIITKMRQKPEVAVVAGVGPGLGAALARRLAHEGCRVGLLARSETYLNALATELKAQTETAVCAADLADPAEVKEAFTRLQGALGPSDVLVYNASAGGPWREGVLEVTPETFERAWRVGVAGAFHAVQAVVPAMLEKGSGAILLTGATSSVRGGALAFSSAKFGLRGFSQALARELWPRGIHVAHVVVDGIIGEPGPSGEKAEEPLLHPDRIADVYWHLVEQDPSVWTLELDVRPNREAFFE
jgi:NAD(P)-dependent dehydrogenase (short-subunit alcohol dehydrogenase family)